MPNPTNADLIWNRACFGEPGSRYPGDVALRALLKFHGLAMNGGVLHAIECLGDEELTAVCKGFRYFGFAAVADELEEASGALHQEDDSLEAELDERYGRQVPEDQVLFSAFEADYQRRPENYAPVL